MASPMTEESKTLLKLLSDGQEHRLEDILRQVADSVAPGRALRKYEERSANYHSKYGERKTAELDDDKKQASGSKYLAKRAVRSLKANYIVVTDTATGPVVRLRQGVEVPSFPKIERGEEGLAETESSGLVEKPLIATEAISEVSSEDEQGVKSGTNEAEEPELADDLEEIEGGDAPDAAAEPVEESAAGPPTCDLCGMLIANADQHEEFHLRYPGFEKGEPASGAVTPPACAFFSEDQVRAIVANEVGGALDDFRQDIQRWMIHRFAAIESIVGRPERHRERGSRW